jgi:hypothetical protein
MTATSNIPLNVPFKEKDEAKSHGARWNPDDKHWYVPVGVDATPFEKWLDGAPAETLQPKTTAQTAAQTKPANVLPANTDMDDVNAMLRDAYEVNDD